MTRGDVAIFVYNVTEKFKRIELRNDDQTIEMPNLVGMSLQEAKDLLEENNILITNVIEKHNDIYDIGIVSQQLPSPGINIKTGVKTVYLTVSIGKAEIRVLNIIFSTLDVEKKTLEDNNINYIVIDEFHEVIPAGYVINTKPFVDELISTDRIIDVYVSAGPQK